MDLKFALATVKRDWPAECVDVRFTFERMDNSYATVTADAKALYKDWFSDCRMCPEDRNRQRRPPARKRDGQRAERDVAQPVADHRIPLEHQRHTQQRRAQRDKDAHDEGADDEWVGKHLQQQAHAVSPPNRLP